MCRAVAVVRQAREFFFAFDPTTTMMCKKFVALELLFISKQRLEHSFIHIYLYLPGWLAGSPSQSPHTYTPNTLGTEFKRLVRPMSSPSSCNPHSGRALRLPCFFYSHCNCAANLFMHFLCANVRRRECAIMFACNVCAKLKCRLQLGRRAQI